MFNLGKECKGKGWIEFSEVRWVNGKKIIHLTAECKEKAKSVWLVTQLFEDKTFAKFVEKMAAHLLTLSAEFCTVCRK